MTQEELATKIGMKKSTVSLYESGRRQPEYETLIKIADVFGVTLDGLFGRGELFPLTAKESWVLDTYRSLPGREKEDAESYLKYLGLKNPSDNAKRYR